MSRDLQIDADAVRNAQHYGYDPVKVASLFGFDIVASLPLDNDRPTVIRHRETGLHVNLDTLNVIEPDR